MANETFQINTEPHEAAVGPHKFLFQPEVYSDELLSSWANLRAVLASNAMERDKPGDTAEQIAERAKAVSLATRQFLAELMEEDSREGFMSAKLPDRVLLEMQRWILGVYGLRPTGASNGSSPQPSTPEPGDASTGTSPTEEPTP